MIDKKTLTELKDALLAEKKELEDNIGKIARPVDKKIGDYEASFEEIGTDKDDNATETDQYSQNISVEINLEKQLREIIRALEKIEKNTYGICEKCQKNIPLERLKANPSAKTCINC